jgi:hypothetical protein
LAKKFFQLAVHLEKINSRGFGNKELKLVPSQISVNKNHCRSEKKKQEFITAPK